MLVHVQIRAFRQFKHGKVGIAHALISVDGSDCVLNQLADTGKRERKRVYGAFKTFEQVNAHQAPYAFFTAFLRQAVPAVMVQIAVLVHPALKDVF